MNPKHTKLKLFLKEFKSRDKKSFAELPLFGSDSQSAPLTLYNSKLPYREGFTVKPIFL